MCIVHLNQKAKAVNRNVMGFYYHYLDLSLFVTLNWTIKYKDDGDEYMAIAQ